MSGANVPGDAPERAGVPRDALAESDDFPWMIAATVAGNGPLQRQ